MLQFSLSYAVVTWCHTVFLLCDYACAVSRDGHDTRIVGLPIEIQRRHRLYRNVYHVLFRKSAGFLRCFSCRALPARGIVMMGGAFPFSCCELSVLQSPRT